MSLYDPNGQRPSSDPDLQQPPAPDTDAPPPPPPGVQRAVAIVECLICSDYPTQFALSNTFAAFGYAPFTAPGELSVTFVVGVSLVDTILLIGLVLLFLHAHGERPRDVIIGRHAIARELIAGVPLIPVALGIAVVVLLAIQRFAPFLHTVETNPLQGLVSSPRNAWLFALVVVIAGGVREEIQRAFLLHRFDVWLGGGHVGVIVTSVAFGFGHYLQGADAAIATGLLGLFWGVVYLRRRSAVAPMVSHAGFNLIQIVQFLVVRA